MKKLVIFCFSLIFTLSAYAAKLDINIIYEASTMKVKETLCGWQPDLSIGYVDAGDDEDCYMTRYELVVPMYGFTFDPVTKNIPADTKCAFYLSFFDSAMPKADLVKTEVTKDGKPVALVKNLVHERTFQGVVILDEGQSIRFSSQKEPSYTIIYVIAVILVSAGVFLILRRR